MTRNQQITDRMTELYQDVLAEDGYILSSSLNQFTDFFLARPNIPIPKITLTSDGTIRVRWFRDQRNVVSVEFTGGPLINMIVGKSQDGSFPEFNFSRESLDAVEGEVERMMGGVEKSDCNLRQFSLE